MAIQWRKTPWGAAGTKTNGDQITIEKRNWWDGTKQIKGYRIHTKQGMLDATFKTMAAAKRRAKSL